MLVGLFLRPEAPAKARLRLGPIFCAKAPLHDVVGESRPNCVAVCAGGTIWQYIWPHIVIREA